MTRRKFLLASGQAAAGASVVFSSLTSGKPFVQPTLLDLQRAGERFQIDISTREGYQTAAWVLRDIRAGNKTGFPNIEMLQLAAWAQAVLAEHYQYTVFEVTSGLRTPGTNSAIEGAARNSRHLPDSNQQFFAMDIKPIGAKIDQVTKILQHPAFGGVGTYNTHVHFDIRDKAVVWSRKK
jgi:uncharacterized protein YcbK (DUF882 family)